MKKQVGIVLLIAVLGFIGITLFVGTPKQQVVFEDDRLRKALLKYDLDDNGVLTVDEAKQVEILKLPREGNYFNYKGMEAFTNIRELHIKENKITDLSFLNSCENLKKIDFSYNHVKDLSPLKACENLESVQFAFNQVTDLSPLTSLTNMTELNAIGNRLQTMAPVSEMKAVKILLLNFNQIEELSPLEDHPNLEELQILENKINSVEPLLTAMNLRKLYVQGIIPIEDYDLLKKHPNYSERFFQ
ncbi:hypothetical protein GCM10008967_05800 [Bacillus carboniphilus]|uniref:Leucine-rich repeat domain-containing protein n=1 Tax=Bacillus carboniphilus TaxID=86663 RepID=A0ABP3FHF8_9BACI